MPYLRTLEVCSRQIHVYLTLPYLWLWRGRGLVNFCQHCSRCRFHTVQIGAVTVHHSTVDMETWTFFVSAQFSDSVLEMWAIKFSLHIYMYHLESLTTHKAAWYIISVMSAPLFVCMSILWLLLKTLTWEVHIFTSGLSPWATKL